MTQYKSYLAFNTEWFVRHQKKLLRALNGRATRYLSRRLLCIDNDNLILRILPNSITWATRNENEFKTEFRTHWKYSKRIYFAFEQIWWTMHGWDWIFADRWVPQLSFGFSTLTAYPDADPETTTVDGQVNGNLDPSFGSWSTMRDGPGAFAGPSLTDDAFVWLSRGDSSSNWNALARSIFLFDTSSLTSNATISDGVMSLYGAWKYHDAGWSPAPDIDIYISAPASNTDLVAGDFDSLGTVSQTGSPIAYASWNEAGYNDFTLDATGRGNISKTGVSKFGTRNANYDVANTAPTGGWSWQGGGLGGYYADQTGTANDPKLVVTYTLPAEKIQFVIIM